MDVPNIALLNWSGTPVLKKLKPSGCDRNPLSATRVPVGDQSGCSR